MFILKYVKINQLFAMLQFGINGSFLKSKTLEEAYYFTVSFVPVALMGNNRGKFYDFYYFYFYQHVPTKTP